MSATHNDIKAATPNHDTYDYGGYQIVRTATGTEVWDAEVLLFTIGGQVGFDAVQVGIYCYNRGVEDGQFRGRLEAQAAIRRALGISA